MRIRSFKAECEVDYFETTDQGMICPICEHDLKTVKSDNGKRQFCRHGSQLCKTGQRFKKNFIENLKKRLMQRKATFQTFLNTANVRVEASHRIAYILGATGKSCLDGELVKQCEICQIPSFR